jgi:enamine deaminase RidA (YjgF/YER057c/UK114 family)/ketosteroid isomerase-like protein
MRIALRALAFTLLAPVVAGAQTATPEQNLKRRNIVLPPPAAAGGTYVPAVRVGDLVFLSATGPVQAQARGKVGKELSRDEGYQAARTTGLNVLAMVRAELGSLDQVRRIVKVVATVNAAPGFTDLPQVANGFSDLMVEVFGETIGKHARSATGVSELPSNLPIAIDVVLEASPSTGLSPADIAAIRATSDRWLTAVRTGRWEDAAMTFTTDAVLRFGVAVYEGRAAIQKFHESMPPFDKTRVLHIDEIDGRGDMAFVSGHSTVVPAGGGKPVVVGRYLDIRLRQPDGTWLFYRDVVTPMPLPAPKQ